MAENYKEWDPVGWTWRRLLDGGDLNQLFCWWARAGGSNTWHSDSLGHHPSIPSSFYTLSGHGFLLECSIPQVPICQSWLPVTCHHNPALYWCECYPLSKTGSKKNLLLKAVWNVRCWLSRVDLYDCLNLVYRGKRWLSIIHDLDKSWT